ncbi:hypothetical protein DCAR_0726854 [Daucus carota subsp. sativus]|uniref:Uncharacterized protein n=1 Tax=Daucus carota subsp. sativus TaxID=79200 RepID=A0A164SL52_DAUCS|nr:hypothetical protein DCAR_0726854 [Daucus carota subsp. sativus]
MAHAPTAPAPPDPNPPDLDATVMDVLPLASSGGNSLALAIALANEAQNHSSFDNAAQMPVTALFASTQAASASTESVNMASNTSA